MQWVLNPSTKEGYHLKIYGINDPSTLKYLGQTRKWNFVNLCDESLPEDEDWPEYQGIVKLKLQKTIFIEPASTFSKCLQLLKSPERQNLKKTTLNIKNVEDDSGEEVNRKKCMSGDIFLQYSIILNIIFFIIYNL